MKNYYIIIPKSLNLDQRLTKYPPKFEYSKDYFLYFLSEIVISASKVQTENNSMYAVSNHFSPLCSGVCQKFCKNYNQYFDYMYENFFGEGRLVWKENYSEGKCYSFKIPDYYWADGELEIITITNEKLITQILKNQNLTIHNSVKKHYNFTIKYFDIEKFEIDERLSLNELFQSYLDSGDYQKYIQNAIKILNFKNGCFNFYLKRETDGRLHTALTSFPKACRKYLHYEGEKLAETDLSASIPFFLSYILSIPHTESKTALLQQQLNSQDLVNHYMLAELSVMPCEKEIQHFKELILNNQIYTFFNDDFLNMKNFENKFKSMFNRDFDGDEDDLRKFSKISLLSMLFAKTSRFKNEQAIFYKYFPSIHNFIKKLKNKKFRNFNRIDYHKKLSYIVFQLESYFMLNKIAREINNVFKRKIPIFTLHDCIVCKESDLPTIIEQVQNIFIREIGYSPNLSSKIWE